MICLMEHLVRDYHGLRELVAEGRNKNDGATKGKRYEKDNIRSGYDENGMEILVRKMKTAGKRDISFLGPAR